MSNELKSHTLSGLFFRFFERISAQLVSTIVSIVLARILLPEDYGIVSLVTIFITISNVFVSDGIGTAIIQKKDPTPLDFSTAFWSGLTLSFVLYLVIFISAPLISAFYNNDLITPILRVMGLRIPVAAINSVQQAYVSKKFLFKKFFWATLLGTVLSGVVGIVLAYNGFGAWSLVVQYLLNVTIDTLMLFLIVSWRPSVAFSWDSFRSLFSFGWKILISGLLTAGYDELRSLIIAKRYTTSDLSFYTKGKQFPQLFGNNVSTTITNVMFPIFSKIQDDTEKIKVGVRRSISVGSFIIFPLLIGLASIANVFIEVVFTEKWLPCVIYVQIFSLMYIFKPLKHISQSAIKAKGRSGLILVLNIVEKAIGISLIFVGMLFGVEYIALGALVTYAISAIMDAVANGIILKYSLKEQLSDTLPAFFVSALMGAVVYFMNFIGINHILLLFIQIFFGAFIYLLMSYLFKIEAFSYVLTTIRSLLKKKKQNLK